MAASLEQQSEHPLARAIVEGARDRSLDLFSVDDFDSVTGGGVHGLVDGTKVLIGQCSLLEENGTSDLSVLVDRADELQQQGRTVMYVAVGGTFAGLVAVSDRIKGSTPEAVKTLHDMGLRLIMLTGDNEKTAKTVAEELGISVSVIGNALRLKTTTLT